MANRNKPEGTDGSYHGGVIAIGVYQVVIAVVLLALLFALWPERDAQDASWLRPTQIGALEGRRSAMTPD